MNNQEIIDNAPKNTSIVDSKFKFFDDVYCELDKKGEWNWKCSMPKYPIRSLADIKRIVELEKEKAIGVYHFTVEEYKAHNLEQQAKGVDWVLACRELNLSEGEVHTLMDKCNDLRNQAKTLKEQVK